MAAAQNPIKGLVMDVRQLQQPEGTYPFGKNGIQYNIKGAVINEEGFRKMAATVPYQFNGIIETDDKPIVFSTDNVNTAIGYFNPVTEQYEPIFDDSSKPYKLGHKTYNWIIGQAQRNYKSEVVCAFTDKFEFPKFFNADNLDVQDLDDWNLFPFYVAPDITTMVTTGGRLPQGTYYVATKYVRNDGTETPYSPLTLGKAVSGDGIGLISNGALEITVKNCDQSYDKVTIAVVSKVLGVTSAIELEEVPIPITGGMAVALYTGDNQTQPLSLEEVLIPPAIYSHIGTMGQLNDTLYIAELEREPEINDMQPYANLVTLTWKSELMNGVGASVEHTSGEKKTFMHEEIYAFYIRYRLRKGGMTKSFVIPGMDMNPLWEVASSEAATGMLAAPKFKVEDIIVAHDSVAKTGTLGPWVNSTETYPLTDDFDSTSLGGRDLRGAKVLHHKMPSLNWCKTNLWSTEQDYGRTKLDVLGVIAANITIPAKYNNVITGYEILYAKRTIANVSVFGQGLMLHGCVSMLNQGTPTGSTSIYTTGGNWHSEVVHNGNNKYDDKNDLRIRNDSLRCHPFDMLFSRPGVNVDYMSTQLLLKATKLRNHYLLAGAQAQPQVSLVDYTILSEAVVPTVPAAGKKLRKLSIDSYAPNGVSIGTFQQNNAETAYVGKIDGPALIPSTEFFMYSYRHPTWYNETEAQYTPTSETTYLINLKGLKSEVYNSFMSQTLIRSGLVKPLNDFSPNWGGDAFICDYTFHTYGRHSADQWDNLEGYKGKKVIRRFVCEAVANIHLRYEVPGNIYSKWYPKTGVSWGPGNSYIIDFDRNFDPNQFGYSNDLNALNDLISSTIFSPFKELLYKAPFRIHRGGKVSRQSKTRSWRTFLPLDYYEAQKNMGRILHLVGMDDKLLIHHENALFLTQDKAKLDSGLLGVTLGTGDIFQFEPQEALAAKLGYAGTQHELACILTPVGYVFIDAKQGEMFIYKNGLKTMNSGLNRFLSKFLNVPGINPFTGNGITLGWDQKFKRILLTVKRKTPPEGTVVKVFEDTQEFFDGLTVGDVVLWKNRYIVYDGV